MKIVKYVLTFVIIIFLSIQALKFRENFNYRSSGKLLIEKVEKFKKQEGRLPLSTFEIDKNDKGMGQGPYYEKKSDSSYIVYFNIGFDYSYIYSSVTKEWFKKP